MQFGPYIFQNKPFILQHWEIGFVLDLECLSKVPLWIKFPSLPVGYWSVEALIKLTSVIGKPLYTDKIPYRMERIYYARVLI